jgi:hypothetical protein
MALFHEEKREKKNALPCIDCIRRLLGTKFLSISVMAAAEHLILGEWLVSGFLAGDGSLDNDRAFRTAIHFGCHLAVIGGPVTGWGSPEDVTRVVSFGRDMIVKGHEKDTSWFRGGPWNLCSKQRKHGLALSVC